MNNDIFIDNCYACQLNNPLKDEQKDFIEWLRESGFLVVSQKWIVEVMRSNMGAASARNISVIVDLLTRNKRLIIISKNDLASFTLPRILRSNKEDWVHVRTVGMSSRKLAVTVDEKLQQDISKSVKNSSVAACVSKIKYKDHSETIDGEISAQQMAASEPATPAG
jgi:hypothetical protein